MSIENAKAYLRKWNIENRVMEFPVSSATVTDAALALHTEEQRIAKTLAFMVDKQPILIVAAGDARVDNKKYKNTFQKKASMLKPDQVLEIIGHPIGGVCPFGIKEGVLVYLDVSLKRFETVFPACGSANSAIELTIPDLEKYSGFQAWVDVCKEQ